MFIRDRIRVDVARDRQADHLELRHVVLARLVATGGDDAALHGPDARLDEQRGGQGLSRELGLRDVRQEPLGVQEHGVTTDRGDDRDAGLQQALAQVADLADAVLEVVVVEGLFETDGHGVHVPSAHACLLYTSRCV